VGGIDPPRLDGAFDNARAGVAAGVMVDAVLDSSPVDVDDNTGVNGKDREMAEVLDSSPVDVFELESMTIRGLNGKDWEMAEVLAIGGARLGSLSMFSNIVLSPLCGKASHQ
jgi:hypothetical protein